MQQLQSDGSYNELRPQVLTNVQQNYLDNFVKFCWLRYVKGKYYGYYQQSVEDMTGNTKVQCKIAKSITVDKNSGKITLNNPIDYTLQKSSSNSVNQQYADTFNTYIPCYLDTGDSTIIYFQAGCVATATTKSSNKSAITWYEGYWKIHETSTLTSGEPAQRVVTYPVTTKDNFEFVYSDDKTTYPNQEEQGGYYYEFLRTPFEKLPQCPVMEFGSYIGTGFSDKDNQIVLKFNLQPYLVMFFYSNYSSMGTTHILNLVYPEIYGDTEFNQNYDYVSVTWGDRQISWYENSSYSHVYYNVLNNNYHYIAFGR